MITPVDIAIAKAKLTVLMIFSGIDNKLKTPLKTAITRPLPKISNIQRYSFKKLKILSLVFKNIYPFYLVIFIHILNMNPFD